MASNRTIFAVGRGQYENIGDIILRRQLLDWVRPAGPMHVYVGHSPFGYDDGLRLADDDVVYRSLVRWYVKILREALAGRASTVFKPGEIQLTLIGMKEHLVMLPAAALVRLRGGEVIRAGVGARNFAPLPRAIMWPSMALSTFTRWRDDKTAAYMRFGAAMPDLGYGEGASTEEISAFIDEPESERPVLVVSMREDHEVDDRPYPNAVWLESVSSFAQRHGLEIWVVTQVTVDSERSKRLAKDLGAQLLDWDPALTHDEQEIALRALYRRTRVALSDRLHVIIMAFTEGAIPVSIQMDDSTKAARHFSTIGIDDITLNTTGLPATEVGSRLDALLGRRAEMLGALVAARGRLAAVRDEVQRRLGVKVSSKVSAP